MLRNCRYDNTELFWLCHGWFVYVIVLYDVKMTTGPDIGPTE